MSSFPWTCHFQKVQITGLVWLGSKEPRHHAREDAPAASCPLALGRARSPRQPLPDVAVSTCERSALGLPATPAQCCSLRGAVGSQVALLSMAGLEPSARSCLTPPCIVHPLGQRPCCPHLVFVVSRTRNAHPNYQKGHPFKNSI